MLHKSPRSFESTNTIKQKAFKSVCAPQRFFYGMNHMPFRKLDKAQCLAESISVYLLLITLSKPINAVQSGGCLI